MKYVLVAALLLAAPAHAGGMAEPVLKPETIAEDAKGTSGGVLIPALLLLLAAVALSSGGSKIDCRAVLPGCE